jgi:hypothetical protein
MEEGRPFVRYLLTHPVVIGLSGEIGIAKSAV